MRKLEEGNIEEEMGKKKRMSILVIAGRFFGWTLQYVPEHPSLSNFDVENQNAWLILLVCALLDKASKVLHSFTNNSYVNQDERELKKQRRKQSNRESARRSRLRKQVISRN